MIAAIFLFATCDRRLVALGITVDILLEILLFVIVIALKIKGG